MPQIYKRLSTVLKEAGLYRTFATMLNETDDDDIAPHAALYWYAADYHGGQDCPLYAVLSLSEYTPGAMERKCPPEYLHLYQRFEDASNR